MDGPSRITAPSLLAMSEQAPRIQAEEGRTHRWRIEVRLRPCDGALRARGLREIDGGEKGGVIVVYSHEESGERGSVMCVETNRGKEGSSKVARLKDLLSCGR
jgi:hypothetical protein